MSPIIVHDVDFIIGTGAKRVKVFVEREKHVHSLHAMLLGEKITFVCDGYSKVKGIVGFLELLLKQSINNLDCLFSADIEGQRMFVEMKIIWVVVE